MWTPHPVHVYLREMAEIVKYIYAMGGTELASALELLHSHGIRREVVVISDGRTTDTERVLNFARRFRRLHVVATERSMFLRQYSQNNRRAVRRAHTYPGHIRFTQLVFKEEKP
jgi:predicted metal-dependent peptidase